MTRLIGAHTVDNGGIHMAARRAGRTGLKALQIFTAIPKYYGDKTSIRPERVQRFREALGEAGLQPANVLVHAAYVLNAATADEEKWGRAAGGLRKELERSTALGVGALCFHPGAATDGDREASIGRVALAISRALEAVPGETKILIENTAGAGLTVGKTPEEVGGMLAGVPPALRRRTGYGLDTCHLFSAGHDISGRRAQRDSRRIRVGGGVAARVLPSQRQRRRPGLEQGPPRAARRGEDRSRAVPLAHPGPP
jgi:deoxyribonuclease-4